jgi:hypothetical protein
MRTTEGEVRSAVAAATTAAATKEYAGQCRERWDGRRYLRRRVF